MYGRDKIKFSILVRIAKVKSIFMRVRHSWNDSIKMDIKIWAVMLIIFYSVVMCLTNGRQGIGELEVNYKITPNFLRQQLFSLIMYCTR
jgi:hypothetical protein